LVVALSMLASQAALYGSTGSPEMLVFQTLSAGNIGQFGAPGTGVPAAAGWEGTRIEGPPQKRTTQAMPASLHLRSRLAVTDHLSARAASDLTNSV
jgi:hypothetical protein